MCHNLDPGGRVEPQVLVLQHLELFGLAYGYAKRIHFVLDNCASPISADTLAFFRDLAPRVQVLLTPSHASWLNQAEPLLEGFSARYLVRGSWPSRSAMLRHILTSRCDYNAHFARRFNWTFTRRDFPFWLNSTAGSIRCKTIEPTHQDGGGAGLGVGSGYAQFLERPTHRYAVISLCHISGYKLEELAPDVSAVWCRP